MKKLFPVFLNLLSVFVLVSSTEAQDQKFPHISSFGNAVKMLPPAIEKPMAKSKTANLQKPVYPQLKRPHPGNSTQNVNVFISTMGESVNPFTLVGAPSRPVLSYDPKSRTILLVRRGGPTDPGGIDDAPGNKLFYDVNTKNGLDGQWQLSKGPVYTNDPYDQTVNNFAPRYPMAVLANPNLDSDTNHLSGIFASPVLSGTNGPWGGFAKGKRKLNNDNTLLDLQQSDFYLPSAMTTNAQNEVFILESIADVSSGSIVYLNKLRVTKGTISPTTQQMTWTDQTINLPTITPTQDFLYSSSSIAFSPKGQVGYITLLARLKDEFQCPISQYYPIVFYTLDGGNTWSQPFVGDPTFSPNFKQARYQLRGDSAYGSQGKLRRVAYSTVFEHDAAVDSLGNLHFFMGLSPSGLLNDASQEPAGSVYPLWVGYYDVVVSPANLTQNQWKVIPIYKPKSFSGGVGDLAGTDNLTYYNSPQVSSSASGNVLVFGLYDTDTTLYDPNEGYKNVNPDLVARALQIKGEGFWLSDVENLSAGSNMGGQVFFGRLTDKFALKGDTLNLFQSSGLLSAFDGVTSPWPTTHLFGNITWKPTEFTLVPEGVDSSVYHTLKGRVFSDANLNCLLDLTEIGLKNRLIKVGNNYTYTNRNGDYYMTVPNGTYAIQYLRAVEQVNEISSCQPNFTLASFTVQSDSALVFNNRNIPVRKNPCAYLRINGAYGFLRPCRTTGLTIQVQNPSDKTAYHVKVSFRQPKSLKFLSASAPLIWNSSDSTYSFLLDSLEAEGQKSFSVIDSVKCQLNIMGNSLCSKILVSFEGACVPVSPQWDGVDLIVKATCIGQVPTFTIVNKGTAMSAPRNYKLYQDSLLIFEQPIQLAAHDSVAFQIPNSNPNKVYRVEIKQSQYHPTSTYASANIHCGAVPLSNSPIMATAEYSLVEKEICGIVRNSYDPNDKQVWPIGAGNTGKILPSSWLEYKIRFMNKGNDTAFTVVVVDTLSNDLTMSSFTEMLASHPYKVQVSGGNPAVLRFKFDNILLPDSVTNLEGSRGFIVFRIKPKDGTPPGTQIRNRAGIYFDFNPPVMTNYTVNTLFEPVLTPGIIDSVVILSVSKGLEPNQYISLYPNPTKGKFTVKGLKNGSVEVGNLLGNKFISTTSTGADTLELDLSAFGRGMYWVRIVTEGKTYIHKMVLE